MTFGFRASSAALRTAASVYCMAVMRATSRWCRRIRFIIPVQRAAFCSGSDVSAFPDTTCSAFAFSHPAGPSGVSFLLVQLLLIVFSSGEEYHRPYAFSLPRATFFSCSVAIIFSSSVSSPDNAKASDPMPTSPHHRQHSMLFNPAQIVV